MNKLYKNITEDDYLNLNLKQEGVLNNKKSYFELMCYILTEKDYANTLKKDEYKKLIEQLFKPLNKEEKIKSIELLLQCKWLTQWNTHIYIKEDEGLNASIWNLIDNKKYKIMSVGENGIVKNKNFEMIREVNKEIINEVRVTEDLILIDLESSIISKKMIDKISNESVGDIWDEETINKKRKEYIKNLTDKFTKINKIKEGMYGENLENDNNTFITQVIVSCKEEKDNENQLNKIRIINQMVENMSKSAGVKNLLKYMNWLIMNSDSFELLKEVKDENKKYLNKDILALISNKKIDMTYDNINKLEYKIDNEDSLIYKIDVNKIIKKNKKMLLQEKKGLKDIDIINFLRDELEDYKDIEILENDDLSNKKKVFMLKNNDMEDYKSNVNIILKLKKEVYENTSDKIRDIIIESVINNLRIESHTPVAGKIESLLINSEIVKSKNMTKKLKF